MAGIHGGDIYTNKVQLDFSVNINPLGIPKEVQQALKRAVNYFAGTAGICPAVSGYQGICVKTCRGRNA